MKKVLPFVLPIAAVLLVVFFASSWYKRRTAEKLATPEITAGAEIEELSVAELASLEKMSRGIGNYQTIKLKGDDLQGDLRYEKKDGKIFLTVTANLPESTADQYALWLKKNEETEFNHIKDFTLGKSGFWAATALNDESLPLQVEVRSGESVLLSGEVK